MALWVLNAQSITGYIGYAGCAGCAGCAQVVRSLHAVYLSKKSDIG